MTESSQKLAWKTDTKSMLEQIVEDPGNAIWKIPFGIFYQQLQEVAKRAIELDDPKLNSLMLRLSLYSIADPSSPDFDLDKTQKLIDKYENLAGENVQ